MEPVPSGSLGSDHRRKWDLEEFAAKARARLEAEEEDKRGPGDSSPKKRSCLKSRDFKLNFETRINQKVVVKPGPTGKQSEGYYCNVCDCVVKDSTNFLDHINGKKHQMNMGMSMRIQRSSLEQVRQRFQSNKEKLVREEKEKKEYDFMERVQVLRGKQEKLKEHRRDQRKKKLEESESPIDLDEENKAMLQAMGFGGFGSTKNV